MGTPKTDPDYEHSEAALRRLTYKTAAITARLEAIYRTLERAQ